MKRSSPCIYSRSLNESLRKLAMIASLFAISAFGVDAFGQRSIANDWDAQVSQYGREATVLYANNGGVYLVIHEGRETTNPPTGKLVVSFALTGLPPQVSPTFSEVYRNTVLDPSKERQRLVRIAAVMAEGYSNRAADMLHVAVITEEHAPPTATSFGEAIEHAVYLLSFNRGLAAPPRVRKLMGSFGTGVFPGKAALAIGLVPKRFRNNMATDYDVVVVAGSNKQLDARVSTMVNAGLPGENEIVAVKSLGAPPDRLAVHTSRNLGMTWVTAFSDLGAGPDGLSLFYTHNGPQCAAWSCTPGYHRYTLPIPNPVPPDYELGLELAAADLDELTNSLFIIGRDWNQENWVTLKVPLGAANMTPISNAAPLGSSCFFPPGIRVVEEEFFTACVATVETPPPLGGISFNVFQTKWRFNAPSLFDQDRADLNLPGQPVLSVPPMYTPTATPTPSIAIDRTPGRSPGPTIVWGRADFLNDPSFPRDKIFLEPGR
jgi:hypothetical protein